MNSTTAETKGRVFLSTLRGELVKKDLRTSAGTLVNVIRPSVFANLCLWKLDSYPLRETGRQGLYLEDYI